MALIERGVLGKTTKYWVTTARRLEKHNLTACALHRPPGMIVGTFLGGFFRTSGELAVVDDGHVMQVLVARCRAAGVLLHEKCPLLSFTMVDNRLNIQAALNSFRARLIVDASGGLSPIAATFRLHKLYGFYSVYGAFLRRIRLHTRDIVLAQINHLGDPPPILEVIPCGDDCAYCAILTYSEQLKPPGQFKSAFRTECAHNPFFTTCEKTQWLPAKLGAIPIGRLRRRRLTGVIPIGEAGLVQPALLGTAFNEVLEHCHGVCSHISQILQTTNGVPAAPGHRYPLLKRIQDSIQLRMMRCLLKGNVEVFDRLVRLMSTLPSETIFAFCSNELTWKQLARGTIRFAPRLLLPYQSFNPGGKQTSQKG